MAIKGSKPYEIGGDKYSFAFDSGKLIGVNKVDASGDFVSNAALDSAIFQSDAAKANIINSYNEVVHKGNKNSYLGSDDFSRVQQASDAEKEVFKTAVELDQIRLVELAGQRQKYLDQGQSLNIFFPAGASKKYVQQVHFRAWETECKGLYYLRTEVSNRAENITTKVELNKLTDYSEVKKSEEECVSCQG